jgi:myosin heavy subunit
MIPSVIAGMNVPPDDVENVRYGEAVKQYRSGRYIDPNNTKIMYERNVVYKVEDDAAWNLRPNAALLRSKEPWNPDMRPRTLDSQKALYSEMETQIKELKRSAESAAKALEAAQKANATSAENRATVQSQTATLSVSMSTMKAISESLKELERKIGDLEAKTKALESAKRSLDAQRQAGDLKPFNPDAPAPDEASEFNPKSKRDAK